ncbi:MAG: hypothetical protein JWL64_2428 [Frankiales bacterium]|nr:hypothetical protein [Frankiales bacterium]
MTRSLRSVLALPLLGLVALLAPAVPAPPARGDSGGNVVLRTVPAVAGVVLSVGGSTVRTDADGAATVQVGVLSGVAASVRVAQPAASGGALVTLGRVDVVPDPTPNQSRLQVGLDVTRRIQLVVDPGSTGAVAGAVTSVRLRSATGEEQTVDPRQTKQVSLLARRARLVHGVLTAQPVTWSVDRIKVDNGLALRSAVPSFDPWTAPAWTLTLAAVSGTVQIATVPATPGVQFLIDGASTVTGPDGNASMQVADLNQVQTGLQLGAPEAGLLEVSLRKVAPGGPHGPGVRTLVAGLGLTRPVAIRFVDSGGRPVPAERITSIDVESDTGTRTLAGSDLAEPVPLLTTAAALVENVWDARPVRHTLMSVKVDGSEAVFAGQQSFRSVTADTWIVRLAVFRVTVTARDALFGKRLSSQLVVTRPDGTSYRSRVAASGSAVALPVTARGKYALEFAAATLGAKSAVQISRDDNIDVRLVTPLDVAVVGAALVLLLAGAVGTGVRLGRRRRGGST